ncbi:hypothetical protein KDN24_18645 [Bacillus sp. Bva_UNVM-123]|uniref:hypothetical protein n=1 Tax=Bacillus sp. Bva_UNVM-123 TaxID=2829798 RepID=UPI00391F4C5F
MNKMVSALFNMKRTQNRFNMFRKKRNNRGILWTTVLSLAVSAAAFGIKRNRNRTIQNSVQNLMSNLKVPSMGQTPKMADLTEFSKELLPDNNQNK